MAIKLVEGDFEDQSPYVLHSDYAVLEELEGDAPTNGEVSGDLGCVIDLSNKYGALRDGSSSANCVRDEVLESSGVCKEGVADALMTQSMATTIPHTAIISQLDLVLLERRRSSLLQVCAVASVVILPGVNRAPRSKSIMPSSAVACRP